MFEEARNGLRIRNLPKPLVAFTALSIAYIVLCFALPPNTATTSAYNLTYTEYRILLVFINIPILVVWFAAFYGYGKLDEYVALVKKAPNGKPLADISNGLKFLAWGLPITSIVSMALAGVTHATPGITSFTIITTHYMSLLVAILAFTCTGIGSWRLTDITHIRPSLAMTRWIFASFTFVGVMFTYFTITASQTQHPNPFRLPMWLILLTIVTPYLYAWFMGLFAAYEIFLYSKQTKGVLYKQALTCLAAGIMITIVSSVMFQYLLVDTTHIRKISFSWMFIGVYLLLLMYAGGFLLFSTGAKRLKKIEEV